VSFCGVFASLCFLGNPLLFECKPTDFYPAGIVEWNCCFSRKEASLFGIYWNLSFYIPHTRRERERERAGGESERESESEREREREKERARERASERDREIESKREREREREGRVP